MSASQNNNIVAMSCREDSDVEEVLPVVPVQRKDIVNTVQSKPFPSTQLHVGSSSHFKLPHGWIVEEKPRPSNPAHFDRYFYEPFTGRKFRSLSSVRKHLAQEAGDHDVTGRISNATNTNTNPSEYGKGQQLEEKASIAIPKWWEVKSDTGEKKVRGPRSCSSCRNRANKPAESSGKKPMKVDNQKGKSSSEKNETPVHNLIGPPPDKVSWVLSSREGFWNPYVDGVAVSEAERLKWAEAFVLSIRASEY